LFSGADLWRDGRFMHGGLLWSPGGIDREGFTLEAMVSGGTYRYASGALNNALVIGADEEAQVQDRAMGMVGGGRLGQRQRRPLQPPICVSAS
jgi:hypothetical protein